MGNDAEETFEEAMARLGMGEGADRLREAEDQLFEQAFEDLVEAPDPEVRPGGGEDPAKETEDRGDRRTVQSARGLRRMVKTGEIGPGATLDLHRMTRLKARRAVGAFLSQSRVQGHQLVTIICGQGLHSQGDAVLPQALDQWLRDDFSHHVVLVMNAPRTDGGQGARYVLLKTST